MYYRLKVIEIHLPPLRDRADDIPLLVNFFLKEFCKKHGVGEKWFSRDALAMLRSAPWKGNVRELKNVVEQAAILSGGEVIGPSDFSLAQEENASEIKVCIPESRLSYKEVLAEVAQQAEQSLIQRALEKSKNNKSKAAKLLGIGRRTLLYKLDKIQ